MIERANCRDAKTARSPKQHPGIFTVTIEDKTKSRTEKYSCSAVYNAQCSLRGNYWDWSKNKYIQPFKTTSAQGNEISVDFPSCKKLTNKNNVSIKDLYVKADGGVINYKSTIKDIHSYEEHKSSEDWTSVIRTPVDFFLIIRINHDNPAK